MEVKGFWNSWKWSSLCTCYEVIRGSCF